MTKALKVAGLPKADQLAIAEKISNGSSAKDIVNSWLDSSSSAATEEETPADCYAYVLDVMHDYLATLEEHAESIVGTAMDSHEASEILRNSSKVFMRLSDLEAIQADGN